MRRDLHFKELASSTLTGEGVQIHTLFILSKARFKINEM